MRKAACPARFPATSNSKTVDPKRLQLERTQSGTLGSKVSITALEAWEPSGVGRRHMFQQTVSPRSHRTMALRFGTPSALLTNFLGRKTRYANAVEYAMRHASARSCSRTTDVCNHLARKEIIRDVTHDESQDTKPLSAFANEHAQRRVRLTGFAPRH